MFQLNLGPGRIKKTVDGLVDKPVRQLGIRRKIRSKLTGAKWVRGADGQKTDAPNRELQHRRDQLATGRAAPLAGRVQPDVVGLQELKCVDEAFPAEAIEALGYAAIWHGQKSWNGVAIFSRVGDPVETRRALPGDPEPRAEPIHRGGDLRDPDRQHVRAQRQSEAGAEVRL